MFFHRSSCKTLILYPSCELVKDNPNFNLINIVKNIFPKLLKRKIRKKYSGTFICTWCIEVWRDLHDFDVSTTGAPHKISSSEKVFENEDMGTSNTVEINQEIKRLAMKLLQLIKINKS